MGDEGKTDRQPRDAGHRMPILSTAWRQANTVRRDHGGDNHRNYFSQRGKKEIFPADILRRKLQDV